MEVYNITSNDELLQLLKSDSLKNEDKRSEVIIEDNIYLDNLDKEFVVSNTVFTSDEFYVLKNIMCNIEKLNNIEFHNLGLFDEENSIPKFRNSLYFKNCAIHYFSFHNIGCELYFDNCILNTSDFWHLKKVNFNNCIFTQSMNNMDIKPSNHKVFVNPTNGAGSYLYLHSCKKIKLKNCIFDCKGHHNAEHSIRISGEDISLDIENCIFRNFKIVVKSLYETDTGFIYFDNVKFNNIGEYLDLNDSINIDVNECPSLLINRLV